MLQAAVSESTRSAVALGPFEDQRPVTIGAIVLTAAVEALARGADAALGRWVEVEVLGPKQSVRVTHRLGLVQLGSGEARIALAKQGVGQIPVDAGLLEVLRVRLAVEAGVGSDNACFEGVLVAIELGEGLAGR